MVLTILADGGFVLQCRATVGNTEKYLEDAEAVGFLGEEAMGFRCEGRVNRPEGLWREGSRKLIRKGLSQIPAGGHSQHRGEGCPGFLLIFLQRQFAQ